MANNGLLQTPQAPTIPDYSVATKVNEITKQNSPLMQQAKTSGIKFANSRGLLNSSIAGQAAQEAVIKQALPIASQDSQQAYGKDIAGMNIAANAQDKAAALAASYEQTYASMFSNIAANENLPKATRDAYLNHLALLRDNNYALVEQFYGIDLQWATPQITA